jgi:Tol biopolymer transport system component
MFDEQAAALGSAEEKHFGSHNDPIDGTGIDHRLRQGTACRGPDTRLPPNRAYSRSRSHAVSIFLICLPAVLLLLTAAAADPEARSPYRLVTEGASANTIAYPTCHSWSADGKWLFIESDRPRPDGTRAKAERQILKVSVENGEARHLATLEVEDTAKYGTAQFGGSSQYHFDYATRANVLAYYDMTGHNLYLLDVATGKSGRVLHEPEGTIGDPPSISPDGTRIVYYALFRSIANRFFGGCTSAVFALDVDPVKLEAVGEPKVITAYAGRRYPEDREIMPGGLVVNHCQIDPTDKDHYCYAHQYMKVRPDGSADLSRCWENVGGVDRPVDICKPGIWQTHEVIGPRGKELFIVERFSVVAVDFRTRAKRRIYENTEKHNPCHISVSPDEKWIVADMWDSDKADSDGLYPSGLLLINTDTGKARVICRFRRSANHPAHPHPNFSPDGKRVAFVVADGKTTCQVAVIDLADVMSGLGK